MVNTNLQPKLASVALFIYNLHGFVFPPHRTPSRHHHSNFTRQQPAAYFPSPAASASPHGHHSMRDPRARWLARTRSCSHVNLIEGVLCQRKNKTVQIVNKQSYRCKFWLQIRILHENMVQESHCEYPNVCTPLILFYFAI